MFGLRTKLLKISDRLAASGANVFEYEYAVVVGTMEKPELLGVVDGFLICLSSG